MIGAAAQTGRYPSPRGRPSVSEVYGSVGCSSEGGSLMTETTGRGDGVEVTPATKPPIVEPIPPATIPNPFTPMYRTPADRARTAATSAIRMTIGTPRLRLIGWWADSRPGPGERGLTLTGAGRPVDGGRGRTCVCRWSRRVVIGRIVAWQLWDGSRAVVRRCVAHSWVRCDVLWRGRARDEARRGRPTTHREGSCRLAIREPDGGRPAPQGVRSSGSGRSPGSRSRPRPRPVAEGTPVRCPRCPR